MNKILVKNKKSFYFNEGKIYLYLFLLFIFIYFIFIYFLITSRSVCFLFAGAFILGSYRILCVFSVCCLFKSEASADTTNNNGASHFLPSLSGDVLLMR